MRDPAYENIQTRLRELGTFCNGIIPHSIGGPGFEPEMSDAIEINKELGLLARKVDALIYAYGEYAQANGMITDQNLTDCFDNVMRNALEGDAMYLIEEGTRARVQDREDSEEDDRADHDYKLARETV